MNNKYINTYIGLAWQIIDRELGKRLNLTVFITNNNHKLALSFIFSVIFLGLQ